MQYCLRTLPIALVIFNVVSGYAFVQAEAIAVARASADHEDVKDNREFSQRMNEDMNNAWHRRNISTLAFAWGAFNIVVCGLTLAAYVQSRPNTPSET